ncbi:MAG: elongation factor 1-beta [Crenarchaeota archaeon]|nr:elongation factor 1-beta [Thermoproteota archaeon]MCR8454160.1 elongation factor 1-beta [Thermoproteota archaeon]MCR8455539.1 elongation factor 1-beta [Thermoproteota archaeon]MCR8463226.1 elongation factor 1-beta [Thermoproteota archaeon]MCR8470843.1 elongation factor 1-beta [Thermoproteota archaeon]
MAENIFVIEVYPDSDEVDLNSALEEIKKRLPGYAKLVDYKIEPFTYGVNKIVLRVKVPEKEGLAEDIESILNEIEGISVEIVRMGRL